VCLCRNVSRMVRAESLVSLQRAVLLASRALSGHSAGARPAAAAVHQALRAAAAALSADGDDSGSLFAKHADWRGVPPERHYKRGWQLGARGYSAAPATASAPVEAGLIVTDKAIQVHTYQFKHESAIFHVSKRLQSLGILRMKVDKHICVMQRLQELADDSPAEATVLRLTVEGGGCSGYTYNFTLEGEARPDDRRALLPVPPPASHLRSSVADDMRLSNQHQCRWVRASQGGRGGRRAACVRSSVV
jgi:alkylation response protein AidB-like acyl-CoA dehydrogenase